MVEILRNKNLATKFQILVEITNRSPNIQQRDIAKKPDVTPQAISDYIKQLVREGLLAADGRSRYRVTTNGVNQIIKVLRELRSYNILIEQAITSISVCAAIAAGDLSKEQTVGLEMKEGRLQDGRYRPIKGRDWWQKAGWGDWYRSPGCLKKAWYQTPFMPTG